MPQKSEFRVYPQRLGTAGETIASCKTKAENLAQQLAQLQPGLKSSASSTGRVVSMVASLLESIHDQAKRMDKAAACVRFSAVRYRSAEQAITGTASGSGAPGAASALKTGGSGVGAGGKADTAKTGGSGVKAGKAVAVGAGAAAMGRYVNNYYESDSGWKDNWKYKSSSDSYGRAYVEKEGKNGKEVVREGYDHTYSGSSWSFLDATKAKPYKVKEGEGNKLDELVTRFKKFNSRINKPLKNRVLERKDPGNPKKDSPRDWSKRVWERRDAKNPAKPNEKKLTRLLDSKEKKKNKFARDIVGIKLAEYKKEVGYEAFHAEKKVEGAAGSASAGFSVLKAEAGVSAGAGVYYVVKNGRRMKAVGADAKAGASFSLIHGNAEGDVGYAPDALKNALGKDFRIVGLEGGAEGKVGHAEAEAGASCRIVDGKLDAAISGDAGAYLCKGSVTGRGNVLGIKVGATAEGNVGFGASGKIGLSGGKLRCEFGLSVGVGFKVKFDIDVSGAVNAVKNGITAAAKAVGNAVKSVGNAISGAARSVGRWFSKW